MSDLETTLDRRQSGERVTVLRIDGGWGMKQRLNQMGIHINEKITVKRNAIFGGPVLIQINGTEVALGRGMAKHVVVM